MAIPEGRGGLRPPRPPPDRGTVVLAISQIRESDVARVCERARSLLESSQAGLLVCDMAGMRAPDGVAVDALARLQLTARRLGRDVQVRHACDQLRELLAFAGLPDVVRCEDLGLEAGGQAEQGEQPGRVEEEGDPADPVP